MNERCTVALEGDLARVAVRQIAGVLARRIVCRVRAGDKLEAGERYGLDPVRLADRSLRATGNDDAGTGGRPSQRRRIDHGVLQWRRVALR